MLKSHLKIAFRNLLRHKSFSLISIGGLAAGMSICLLVITFLRQQMSYDTFHENGGRIYHLYCDYKARINSSSHLYATSPVELGRVMQETIPGVNDFVTLRRFGGSIKQEKEKLKLNGFYATGGFLRMLDFELLRGNPASALTRPNTLVLTTNTAERLFGAAEPLGKTLEIDGRGEFLVTGVIAETKQPTVFDFEVLVSFASLTAEAESRAQLSQWENTVRNSYNFIMLDTDAAPDVVLSQLPRLIATHFPGDSESHMVALQAQKLTRVAMGPIMDNQITFILPAVVLDVLAGIAGVILLAACFNYVSLSLARALRRSREVGVRKVVGAARAQIVRQFLVEAVCIALISVAVAALFLGWLVEGFNNLTPIQLTQSQYTLHLTDFVLYVIFITFALLVGMVSGLYPAFYLSRFLPTVVLKGMTTGRQKGYLLRKSLIVTQFALSLVFIVSAVLLYQQSEFVTHTDYGFNEQNVINVDLGEVPYKALRSELLRYPGVVDVSAVSILTGSGGRNDTWLQSPALAEHIKGYSVWVDEQTIENLQIPVVAGQTFSVNPGSRAILLNETAVERLQLGSPMQAIDQLITIDDAREVQVMGVVKDYRFFSALSGIDPLVLRHGDPSELKVANIRFHPGDYDGVLAHLTRTWEQFTAEPLQYKLYEDHLQEAIELRLMRDFLKIIGLAAGFAVLIACLGLLGITAFITETRLKEVGVRKVLGASTTGVLGLLSKSYVVLVAVAIVLAVPLTWFVNNLWLENLGNRIQINPLAFVTGVVALLIIGLLTIGSQTWRAARTNPVEILKYE